MRWKEKWKILKLLLNSLYKMDDIGRKLYGRIIMESSRIIMDCSTTAAYKFWTRQGFRQYGVILIKEQSMLTKIMSSLEGEIVQTIVCWVIRLIYIIMTLSFQKIMIKMVTATKILTLWSKKRKSKRMRTWSWVY